MAHPALTRGMEAPRSTPTEPPTPTRWDIPASARLAHSRRSRGRRYGVLNVKSSPLVLPSAFVAENLK
jgi:hypothetical protein